MFGPTGIAHADDDQAIKDAAAACADAIGGEVGIQGVGVFLDALQSKDVEAMRGALMSLGPEGLQRIAATGSCAWLTAQLWLHPQQAG
ncbi:MAG: hypothetical protein M3Z25_14600 [Actinomycetota bacterium]|nr:hypothetical protein [Actinomycetota bacterium]